MDIIGAFGGSRQRGGEGFSLRVSGDRLIIMLCFYHSIADAYRRKKQGGESRR